MTETLESVEPQDEEPLGPAPEALDDALLEARLSPDEVAIVAGLVRRAKDQGLALTGPGGLLKSLTKTVLETDREEELSEHLGYDKHDPVGRNLGNSSTGRFARAGRELCHHRRRGRRASVSDPMGQDSVVRQRV